VALRLETARLHREGMALRCLQVAAAAHPVRRAAEVVHPAAQIGEPRRVIRARCS
jgi:hypothetical protein